MREIYVRITVVTSASSDVGYFYKFLKNKVDELTVWLFSASNSSLATWDVSLGREMLE